LTDYNIFFTLECQLIATNIITFEMITAETTIARLALTITLHSL